MVLDRRPKKNRAFTVVEFLLYIGIAVIFIAVVLPLINRITKYTSLYQSKINLRNEFSKVIQKINYHSQISDTLNILESWGIMFSRDGDVAEIRLSKPNLINGTALTGFAWSYQAGGIKLNGITTDGNPYGVNRVSASSCQTSTSKTIDSNFSYQGFAWSPAIGWIKFRDNVGGVIYGVCEDQNGKLRGWAWNNIIGWISFNCLETSPDPERCMFAVYNVSQSNNRLIGYAYNDSIGWIKFDGDNEKIYLWNGETEEQLTNDFVKVKSLNFENIGDTIQFNLNVSNLDETKTIAGTSTIFKWKE